MCTDRQGKCIIHLYDRSSLEHTQRNAIELQNDTKYAEKEVNWRPHTVQTVWYQNNEAWAYELIKLRNYGIIHLILLVLNRQQKVLNMHCIILWLAAYNTIVNSWLYLKLTHFYPYANHLVDFFIAGAHSSVKTFTPFLYLVLRLQLQVSTNN
jgi:hypothetical protein